jgi:hypothetical protein
MYVHTVVMGSAGAATASGDHDGGAGSGEGDIHTVRVAAAPVGE